MNLLKRNGFKNKRKTHVPLHGTITVPGFFRSSSFVLFDEEEVLAEAVAAAVPALPITVHDALLLFTF